MGNQDARGQRLQQVVKVTISAARLVANLESVRQTLQRAYQLLDRPNLRTKDDLSCLVEYADRDALAVDVESDVKHRCLRSQSDGKLEPKFHVTDLTETSYIDSRRRSLGGAGRQTSVIPLAIPTGRSEQVSRGQRVTGVERVPRGPHALTEVVRGSMALTQIPLS